MYFFSNSPVRWRLTKVVCKVSWVDGAEWRAPHLSGASIADEDELEGGVLLLFSHGV
jgi:hypothetical protein